MMSTPNKTAFGSVPLLVLFVAVPALAAAPTSPDPQYDSFDASSKTIKDRYTKLEWTRRVLEDSTKGVGEFHCTGSAFPSGIGRLPTIKELLTIFDEEPHLEYENGNYLRKNIDQSAFDEAAGEDFSPIDLPYWSQTPGRTAGTFFTLDFGTGVVEERSGTSGKAHTRCVR